MGFQAVAAGFGRLLRANSTRTSAKLAGVAGVGQSAQIKHLRQRCGRLDVPGTAHGLRKAKATLAAERGATVNELDAMFGWRGGKMAARYTDKADRAKLAIAGARKLGRESA
jgi:integrase